MPEVFGGTSLWKYLMEIAICLKRQFGCKSTSNLDSPGKENLFQIQSSLLSFSESWSSGLGNDALPNAKDLFPLI